MAKKLPTTESLHHEWQELQIQFNETSHSEISYFESLVDELHQISDDYKSILKIQKVDADAARSDQWSAFNQTFKSTERDFTAFRSWIKHTVKKEFDRLATTVSVSEKKTREIMQHKSQVMFYANTTYLHASDSRLKQIDEELGHTERSGGHEVRKDSESLQAERSIIHQREGKHFKDPNIPFRRDNSNVAPGELRDESTAWAESEQAKGQNDEAGDILQVAVHNTLVVSKLRISLDELILSKSRLC